MKWLLRERFSQLDVLGLIVAFAITNHNYWYGTLFLFLWCSVVLLIEHHYQKVRTKE